LRSGPAGEQPPKQKRRRTALTSSEEDACPTKKTYYGSVIRYDGFVPSPFGLRLDDKTRQRVERIARRRKVPASQVIREAIFKCLEAEEGDASPYESIADLVGIARGGDIALSKDTGRRFAQLLKERPRHP
jgi:hypothetical protein